MTSLDTTRAASSFDHHSLDFARNRFEILAELRSQCPVMRAESYGGFWVVTDFKHGRNVLRDDSHFICARDEAGKGGLLIPELARAPQMRPGELDGAEHLAYRTALRDKFSPQAIATLRPRITEITNQAIDAIILKGDFDVVADIGDVVPTRVMFEYLGIPESDYGSLLTAIESGFSQSLEAAEDDAGDTDFQLAWEQILAVVADRRAHPSDDIISHLASSTDPQLTDDQLVSVVLNLALGGIRTVASLIAYTLHHLQRDLGLRRWLIEHPNEIANSVEEFVRFYAPAVSLARTAVSDSIVAGVQIKAGDRLYVAIPAANRDPDVYDNPDVLDLSRLKRQNLSFGIGAHYCPGVHLARLEFDILLTEILRRLPGYVVDLDRAEESPHMGIAAMWVAMPARV
jgi:cytochrome P450